MTTLIVLPAVTLFFMVLITYYISAKYPYKKVYWFLEFFHLAAGFFVAAFMANFISSGQAIIILVLVVGLFWEIWEFYEQTSKSFKKFARVIKLKQTKMTLSDTILDLILDIGGGALFVLLVWR